MNLSVPPLGRALAIGLVSVLGAWPVKAQQAPIGFIKSMSGYATVTHGQLTYAAELGMPVHEGDMLRTFLFSGLGVTFKDNTRLGLGPSSRVTVSQFVFAPAQDRYSFTARLIAGTMHYVSGLITKLSPEAVKIETPNATIGVRGTRFVARVDP